ncbi:MAG: SDR family oxidoreductase [Undibacterium sp.]|uniref:SDR family oxidoreductase n=1 Tax=Undibacterium sp. TaxID=1914977 RepID=UPI002720947E|nr:SDR family oxidoreductase [Undibacterium sp.]MDO8652909.1 SDR family oxidoreductase [Undibacterium sp.]
MRKPRVLITGGTGLLALNWACAVRDQWDVILGTHLHRVSLSGVTSAPLDLDNWVHLEDQIALKHLDLIVHTVGLTNVEACEDDTKMAFHVNAVLAENVARVANRLGLPFVHVSTDHLFAGESSFYTEKACPKPLNEYGHSKLLAEELVQKACPYAIILRTNFFGWGYTQRRSFSDWLIYGLRAGERLPLFDDVYFTPILADFLAQTTHDLVTERCSGIFNVVGDQRLSKYDFALSLAESFNLPASLIQRVQSPVENLRLVRPRDMSLNNTKVRTILNRKMGTVRDYLLELKRQEETGRRQELSAAVT